MILEKNKLDSFYINMCSKAQNDCTRIPYDLSHRKFKLLCILPALSYKSLNFSD